jgi:hypothetical protein
MFPVVIGVAREYRGETIMSSQQMTHSKRLLIRSGLVTGSTLATLMGAQILATLDQQQFNTESTAKIAPIATDDVNLSVVPDVNTIPLLPTAANTPVAVQAAPNIVILRHPGQTAVTIEDTAPSEPPAQVSGPQIAARVAIQPPNPVAIAPPAPVIIQGEAPPPIIVQVQGSSSSSSSPRSRSS